MRMPRTLQQGFTLIEILIVVFIIGLMAGMISLSLGSDKKDNAPYREAQALMQAVDFVSEYAALNGEVLAMFISPRESETGGTSWCYRWQRFRDNSWSDLADGSLSEHCMPDTVQWELVTEGHLYNYDPDLEIQPPVLVFAPGGDATPVEISLFEPSSGSEPQHIEIDMMGASHWREQDEAKLRDEN